LDEFLKVGNEALALGLVKKGYDEEVGKTCKLGEELHSKGDKTSQG